MRTLYLFVAVSFAVFAIAGFYGGFHFSEGHCPFAQFTAGCDMSGAPAYAVHHLSGFLQALQSVPSEFFAAIATSAILGVVALTRGSPPAILPARRRWRIFSYFSTHSEIGMKHWRCACYGVI